MIYTQKNISNNKFKRVFSESVDVDELKWHKDQYDRIVSVELSKGWKLQMDEELPQVLQEGKKYFIPKDTFHRVIKGTGDLKITITENNGKYTTTTSQHINTGEKRNLIENTLDTSARQITKFIISKLKEVYQKKDTEDTYRGVKFHYSPQDKIPEIDFQDPIIIVPIPNKHIASELEFILEVKTQFIEGLNNLYAMGYANNSDDEDILPGIEIQLQIDPKFLPKAWETIYMEVIDTVRHEMEHLTQQGWNKKAGRTFKNDQQIRKDIQDKKIPAKKYFTLPKELPAILQGLRLRAKKSKQPFKDVAREFLERFKNIEMITPDDIEEIIHVWRKYLPKLGIKQEL